MKLRFFLAFLGLFANIQLFAQGNCATWQVEASPKEAKIGDVVTISFFVTPKPDWYVYSSDFEEGGPQVTKFKFEPNSSYALVGNLEAINSEKKYDNVFEMEVRFFKKKGEFRQKVKILKKDFKLAGTIEYQTCSDKTGQCIPCEYDFNFSNLTIKAENTPEKKNDKDTQVQNNKINQENLSKNQPLTDSTEKNIVQTSSTENQASKSNLKTENTTSTYKKTQKQDTGSIWLFALGAFLAGFLALLTPCVYPMIPMTVSIFMKGDKPINLQADFAEQQAQMKANRRKGIIKALIYGFSIIIIYGILGLLTSLAFGIEFNNDFSTHWIPNLIFFAIFIIFGMSFLGMFEIILPSSFVNKIDRKADGGGYGAVFFMAFTLVLVSFSCTAPIAGSIILLSVQGEVIKPLVGMVAYSLAFAIPFTFFALFPTAMKSLPKSGGWLNTVKVFLGFLELALAFKFLSTADLAHHWGILNRDVFLAIWIAIFGALALYLFGFIQLPHDSKIERLSVPRTLVAILASAFTIYMLPGLWGANLKLLSGIIPPETTQDFSLDTQIEKISYNTDASATDDFPKSVKYGDFLHLPYGLKGFFDYKEGMAYAKKVNKPVFLDFTGHGCANCRKMEEYVWVKPEILSMLKNDYVIISLYTDDKTELPESEWIISKVDGKVKKTIGKINLHFEAERFDNIAQPYYCLLDTEGNLLVNPPKGYEPDVKEFEKYLKTGLEVFKSKKKASL
ncbi:protein-disulfide reductase DsbD family protein [Raineya orbicola]|uniref:Cytochrome C biogenesis protein transmembrane region n=1 Tax=Raineya orbicola TaxID=2016530 RepID=A0A2N3IE65_9BACT|nr:thioredoxin family protein [Raineya orbicola]PKQ68601.1 Cytochrome C biogenesis protein transmembrane region [Raineya orbicola]